MIHPRLLCLGLLVATQAAAAPPAIPLYPGPAPGSEGWKQERRQYHSALWNNEVVTNVSQPTLTVFAPQEGSANGTAIVVCPGGGFHALSIDTEGTMVAEWLAAHGVTAFLLEYRLVASGEDAVQEMMTKGAAAFQRDAAPVIPLAVADGLAAVSWVRRHAADYGIEKDRIGIIGFSAGGTVVTGVALGGKDDSRADFVAPIYAAARMLGEDRKLPDDAPPAFILAASDDQLGLAADSVALWQRWTAAGKSAELHLFAHGGHGFGMKQQNLPSDDWIERFGDWLDARGLLE